MKQPENQLVEHFFRHESANLVAVLTRAFGIRRIDLVEDMVQVAMLEAMHAWKQSGVPEKPAAWIHRVAKNRILDALRREKIHEKAIALSGQSIEGEESVVDQWLEEEQLPDSLLRMIFVCCHPSLERKTQIALTLKTLCGFGISEIARGLMLPEETVKKRIQRAKNSLATANVSLELPDPSQLTQRLDVVHDVLYLMFNEGYSTSHGTEPIRADICEEAARLCHLLCESTCSLPATRALLALMLFHAARFDARTDEHGAIVLLEDQNRTQWDRCLIVSAQSWLAQSKSDQPTTFHLEAAIAMQHCVSPSLAETDWQTIVLLYSRLLQLRESPVYTLNRAIALGQAGETGEALSQLQSLQSCEEMQNYFLLDCAFSHIYELEGNTQAAIDACLIALSKAVVPHEKELLERKLRKLTDQGR
ncbi:RNA polymerase sigma factor [Gimesia panareensis]|uniref:RNA polymerase sigma factor n=1 Tax=Gimesia panareensis TaxID=2527978 RepID=A0A518FQ59_9PLAN|nr:sigma-70 family RNA polymerase sigma factor [Gimesia panareensis]QDT25506.1 RNA polymerase sigma factor [Gimesia panareensis]QDU48456.1 RNA polymerase sigma factor [Gimesia panareensis]QDV18415.1 RNA polymerase sigma factor [Gimesia panareensis]